MTGCSERTRARRPCPRLAKVEIDGRLLCAQHGAIAARKAAEAAEEAAYWEKMFTPTPEQPYRADPEWQAARRDWLGDHPDETDAAFIRIAAIFRLREIESRYKAATAAPAARCRS